MAGVIDKYLHNQSCPLVLATVKELAPLWNSSSKYRHTLDELVQGNPDYKSPVDLHQAAWPLAVHALHHQQEKLYQKLCELTGTPRTAIGLEKALPAAAIGRVDTLFVDTRRPVFGRFEPATAVVEIDGGAMVDRYDLLEIAIAETLSCHGNVYPLGTTAAADKGPTEAAQALLRF